MSLALVKFPKFALEFVLQILETLQVLGANYSMFYVKKYRGVIF